VNKYFSIQSLALYLAKQQGKTACILEANIVKQQTARSKIIFFKQMFYKQDFL